MTTLIQLPSREAGPFNATTRTLAHFDFSSNETVDLTESYIRATVRVRDESPNFTPSETVNALTKPIWNVAFQTLDNTALLASCMVRDARLTSDRLGPIEEINYSNYVNEITHTYLSDIDGRRREAICGGGLDFISEARYNYENQWSVTPAIPADPTADPPTPEIPPALVEGVDPYPFRRTLVKSAFVDYVRSGEEWSAYKDVEVIMPLSRFFGFANMAPIDMSALGTVTAEFRFDTTTPLLNVGYSYRGLYDFITNLPESPRNMPAFANPYTTESKDIVLRSGEQVTPQNSKHGFFVGQWVRISGILCAKAAPNLPIVPAGKDPSDSSEWHLESTVAQIVGISFDANNQMTLTFLKDVFTLPADGTQSLRRVSVVDATVADVGAALIPKWSWSIERMDLILAQKPLMPGLKGPFSFMSFEHEAKTVPQTNHYEDTFHINKPTSGLLFAKRTTDQTPNIQADIDNVDAYTITIDNVDTTNRPVKPQSPLQSHKMLLFMDAFMRPIRSLGRGFPLFSPPMGVMMQDGLDLDELKISPNHMAEVCMVSAEDGMSTLVGIRIDSKEPMRPSVLHCFKLTTLTLG